MKVKCIKPWHRYRPGRVYGFVDGLANRLIREGFFVSIPKSVIVRPKDGVRLSILDNGHEGTGCDVCEAGRESPAQDIPASTEEVRGDHGDAGEEQSEASTGDADSDGGKGIFSQENWGSLQKPRPVVG